MHVNSGLELAKKAFARSTMQDIFERGAASELLADIVDVSRKNGLGFERISDLYSIFFEVMKSEYRNEYVFKNALAQKIVKGRHKYVGATFINELKIRSSVADTVIVNGTSSVYEIKTEFDSFFRLESQLETYRRVFDKIYVVVSPDKVSSVVKYVAPDVGILSLSKRFKLSELREAKSNKGNVCQDYIFSILRKDEYCNIISKKFGALPAVAPIDIAEACAELFRRIPAVEAHDYMVTQLRLRRSKYYDKAFLSKVPSPLLAAVMSSSVSKPKLMRFAEVMF
ncbi:sce7726 family protein [Pseudomonas sp. NPDC087639]|uniref:sce7726 family protein n=1 Tax=Pseudomonas sp. NPDC087639 TaxID=3364445 RepID=UPI0037FD4835